VILYNHDWMNKYRGQSTLVLKPKSAHQVAHILKYCNENMYVAHDSFFAACRFCKSWPIVYILNFRIAVCPQGGNTGLVGGSVPVFDEVVISMASMNNIR